MSDAPTGKEPTGANDEPEGEGDDYEDLEAGWEALNAQMLAIAAEAREKRARGELPQMEFDPDDYPESLGVYPLSEIIDHVEAAPPPSWLFQPIWVAGDYGMFSAEDKAGKSWAMTDAAVSKAAGLPWLGIFPVERPGPVLIFLGEGGERKAVRRIEAVCRARGIENPRDLPIRMCLKVPKLTSSETMRLVEGEVASRLAELVIIDPLYLAVSGANASSLTEMGELLEKAQGICQRWGASLMISHHWNKTGEGRGARRMTGVGPSAWGRVLVSALVTSERIDPVTRGSAVTLELDLKGDEIAEQTVRLRRRVWADDPEDPGSALHYEVERLADPVVEEPAEDELHGQSPSAVRVYRVLTGAGEDWQSVRAIGDGLAVDGAGYPLTRKTIQVALKDLLATGLVEAEPVGKGMAGGWRLPTARALDDHDDDRLSEAAVWDVLKDAHRGISAPTVAGALLDMAEPAEADVKKVHRRLGRLVADGSARREEGSKGGEGGSVPVLYFPISNPLDGEWL